MSGKQARRVIVERLRAEGYQAFIDGKNQQSCPYTYMDAMQWQSGWTAAQDDFKRHQATDFVKVPREPTLEMEREFQSTMACGGSFKESYAAMIEAAP